MMPAGMTANLDLALRLTALWTRLVDTVSGIITEKGERKFAPEMEDIVPWPVGPGS
jgi:hypothetical protein